MIRAEDTQSFLKNVRIPSLYTLLLLLLLNNCCMLFEINVIFSLLLYVQNEKRRR